MVASMLARHLKGTCQRTIARGKYLYLRLPEITELLRGRIGLQLRWQGVSFLQKECQPISR